MLDFDVFNNDAFTAVEMTKAVDRYAYVPGTFSAIPGLIQLAPVRTKAIWIEERGFAPALIQVSPRGAPPDDVGGDTRAATAFRTLRIAQSSTITADELQDIREFGQSDLKSLQVEMGRRQMKLKQNHALTKEFHILNLVTQGKVFDPPAQVPTSDRSALMAPLAATPPTLLYDWSVVFNKAQPAEVPFTIGTPAAVSTDNGSVRASCNQIVRTITRNLQGMGGTNVRVLAACGDEFWDALVTSREVKQTYLNWSAAADLRADVGRSWSAMTFGEIGFFNYRGTDDNSTVAVPTDRAKFFPVGAGIFQWALSPAEKFEFVNTLGKDMYSWIIRDMQQDMWAKVVANTYPLPVCVQPNALMSGRVGP